MHRRPLDRRFNHAVLDERKITTIRDIAWPVGKPIVLYNWKGAAYRSKQIDIATIKVTGFWPIEIAHREDGTMVYTHGMAIGRSIYITEGFGSMAEMDGWFRPLVKPGRSIIKMLMRFRLQKGGQQ